MEMIKNIFHEHPLTLCENEKNNEPSFDESYSCTNCGFYANTCSACNKEVTSGNQASISPAPSYKIISGGDGYGCDKCRFDLHPECTSLKPNIKQKSHPHLLIHVDNLSYQSNCEACGSGIRGVPFIRCVQCRLDFHIQCGPDPIPPTALKDNDECKSDESQEGIENFSHEHPLITSEVADFSCKFCYKNINGRCYGCAVGCEFYIHISCGEFPQEIPQDQFRPPYFFKLLAVEKPTYQCRACCIEIQGFRYRCDVCDFDLHPECTSMKATIEYECHDHILTLIENETYDGECEA
ncbi:cysteine/Histidine-rich C1 domain family protein [Citrus sinensis]|uniref:Cysteine/Histidine-rich C1 domain family protein n=1 Tax=Citrus sinensis TaxID=2711 RepID=A0ACB8JKJ0_CITSI|nr:cysteine/Histidine-rich C1 domain family protein [Citrus sinensis]